MSRSKRSLKPRAEPPRFVTPLLPVNVPVHRCPVPREQASHRFLIQRMGAFGDILMGTVILPALRDAYPEAHFTWIAEHSEYSAIHANPFIDEVIVWNTSYWKRMVRRVQYAPWLRAALLLRRELQRRHYDTFISFQPEEWPLLALHSGAKTRIGIFDTFRRYYRAQRTSSNTRYYQHAYAHPELPEHRIEQYFLTLDALQVPRPAEPLMSFGYTENQQDTALRFLHEQQLEENRFIVLVPQTTWPTKCWPEDRFIALANQLGQEGWRIVLSGSPKEAEAIAGIAAQISPDPVVVAGHLSFGEFAALLDRAALLVSGDTGPMHLATALKTPYVALFGPTAPRWYGPLTGPGRILAHPVPCGPCDQKICPLPAPDTMQCMRLITVPEAYEAARHLLGPRPASLPAEPVTTP